MVENIEIATFLEGGEVTFSTGIGLSNEFELINLIEGIIKSKASGIVINIGPYIKKSEEILNVDLSKLEIREMIDIAYKLHDIL